MFARMIGRLVLLGCAMVVAQIASAEELVLTKESEFGFRKVIMAAQRKELGSDVDNANVGVSNDEVRIELLRSGETIKVLLLRHRADAASAGHGYFEVRAGAGATDIDVQRLAAILDRAFPEDPFAVSTSSVGIGSRRAIPNVVEAWRDAGARGVWRALTAYALAPAPRAYTVAVVFVLAIGAAASLIALWLPPRDRSG
jgi:hypothetical protein